jgi:hypothetical protein
LGLLLLPDTQPEWRKQSPEPTTTLQKVTKPG